MARTHVPMVGPGTGFTAALSQPGHTQPYLTPWPDYCLKQDIKKNTFFAKIHKNINIKKLQISECYRISLTIFMTKLICFKVSPRKKTYFFFFTPKGRVG